MQQILKLNISKLIRTQIEELNLNKNLIYYQTKRPYMLIGLLLLYYFKKNMYKLLFVINK